MSAESRPVPEPTPVSRPFWQGLTQHRILVQYSPSLRRYVFYPRTLAPGSLADDLEWREIDGAGTLYTFTVARRPTGPPWVDAVPSFLRWCSGMPGRESAPSWWKSTRATFESECG